MNFSATQSLIKIKTNIFYMMQCFRVNPCKYIVYRPNLHNSLLPIFNHENFILKLFINLLMHPLNVLLVCNTYCLQYLQFACAPNTLTPTMDASNSQAPNRCNTLSTVGLPDAREILVGCLSCVGLPEGVDTVPLPFEVPLLLPDSLKSSKN